MVTKGAVASKKDTRIMFIKARTLDGFQLQGQDGRLGTVDDFYYDDQQWTIRYLIANTGSWLADRQVLISPYALRDVNLIDKLVNVDLPKDQFENSPLLETGLPVSAQFEEDYYKYYLWPSYWGGPFLWGAYPGIPRDPVRWQLPTSQEKAWGSHVRSIRDLRGNEFHATDGDIGHVSDAIIDDTSWEIRYFIIDTHNWWPGKKVLIDPKWIESVSWGEEKVSVNLTREAIRQSPEYTPEALLRRDYEVELYRHYQRPGYWETTPPAQTPVGSAR